MPGKYRVSGALFAKDAPNGPVFAGTIEIDGVKTAISVWEKVSAAGNNYLQITEDKRAQAKIDGGQQAQAPAASKFRRPAPPKPSDDDDSIPF